ncbi:hypothetical protein SETIT_7G202700v2 [Setaria italica]|uniref:Uncharacterized protein n=2 Tax=Setaria TaxID=4554 RepID=A0A368RXV8_SETIT|nr:hypothetical protein SETIT_7G202700v2 [Setaria italica]TKW06019.1 hypothetical protein SEVIR_7G214700v2 [Setaria viridis]
MPSPWELVGTSTSAMIRAWPECSEYSAAGLHCGAAHRNEFNGRGEFSSTVLGVYYWRAASDLQYRSDRRQDR